MSTNTKRRVLRAFGFTDAQVRAEDGGTFRFRGHAAVFDKPSVDFGGFREMVGRSAFDNTLAADPRVLMLHNHDPNLVLSSTDNETLDLSIDDTGLAVDARFAPVSYAQDVATLYGGDNPFLRHMSFGFWIINEHQETRDGVPTFVLDEVDLDGGDVSTVAYPAYPDTDGEMRARFRALRDAGVEIADARRAVDDLRSVDRALVQLRAGKVLSQANRDLVQRAVDALTELLEAAEPEEERSGDTPSILDIDRDRILRLHEVRL